jgi:hypothetical protein
MALPFRRHLHPCPWNPAALAGPHPALTLREWQVGVLLSRLSPVVRAALCAWLLAPTDLNRWPPPEHFHHQRLPIRPEEQRGQPRSTACHLLYQELKVIRQTLDMPPQVLSVMTHNGLLAVHAIRLQQLERWLWPPDAARQIHRLIA